MSNYTETAVANASKECLASQKEGSGYEEFIVKQLSSELAERIMRVLEYEKEIVVSQSDLRVSEFTPTNSVEYRRQIIWSPLVRCKDCKWYKRKYPWNGNIYECSYLEAPMDDDDFCSWGERREDER